MLLRLIVQNYTYLLSSNASSENDDMRGSCRSSKGLQDYLHLAVQIALVCCMHSKKCLRHEDASFTLQQQAAFFPLFIAHNGFISNSFHCSIHQSTPILNKATQGKISYIQGSRFLPHNSS